MQATTARRWQGTAYQDPRDMSIETLEDLEYIGNRFAPTAWLRECELELQVRRLLERIDEHNETQEGRRPKPAARPELWRAYWQTQAKLAALREAK